MLSPLAATRLNRPNRSTNITVACGTILIVFTAMISSTMPMKNRRKISRKLPTTSAWNSINDASDMIHLRRFADYDGVHYIETTRVRQLCAWYACLRHAARQRRAYRLRHSFNYPRGGQYFIF